MITLEQYNQAFKDFKAGQISEEQWREIVNTVWLQKMEENKDVFIRLKNR